MFTPEIATELKARSAANQPVIGWTKGYEYRVHVGPDCPAAARVRTIRPEVMDLRGGRISVFACKACKGRGWLEATPENIDHAAQRVAHRLGARGYSDVTTGREADAVRGRLTRELESFVPDRARSVSQSAAAHSILAAQVGGDHPQLAAPEPERPTSPEERAERALAMVPDAGNRDEIARARFAVAQEIRLGRTQLARLAQGAYRVQELADLFERMDVVVQRLKRLAARVGELEAMSAEALRTSLAEDFPGAQLNEEDGTISGLTIEVHRG